MASTISSLLVVSTLLISTACSRRATCAMEGCTKNDQIVLATDFESEEKASQDADAVADQNSKLEKEIHDIKARMDLNDSMTKALSETISLHEKRIAALEDKSTAIETSIKDLSDRATDAEEALWDLNDRIEVVELQLSGDGENAGLVAELSALQEQQSLANEKIAKLKKRIRSLEQFQEEQEGWNFLFTLAIQKLSNSIGNLRDRIKLAEKNIGFLQEAVDCINDKLKSINKKVSNLQAEVAEVKSAMATDAELDAARSELLSTLRAEIKDAQDTLQDNIDAVEEIADSKSDCEIGAKYREGLLWYRNITCEGKSLKILVL